jgi:DNA-binding NtrC family response regulator
MRGQVTFRELDNVIQRAVILAEDDEIASELLVLEPMERVSGPLAATLELPFRDASVEFERAYFTNLLRRARNNKSRAAAIAGLDRTVLHAHLRKIGLTQDNQ